MESKEVKQTKISALKAAAYMGHVVLNAKGKKLSWKRLQAMGDKFDETVNVETTPGFNVTYKIVTP